jgi:hypothetical protein
MMAAHRKRSAEKDEQRKADAPRLIREEAALRNTIALHKGTAVAHQAAIRLEELTHSMEYLSNMYVLTRSVAPLIASKYTLVQVPEKRVAKLPWDHEKYITLPFFVRDEYARTHSENPEDW